MKVLGKVARRAITSILKFVSSNFSVSKLFNLSLMKDTVSEALFQRKSDGSQKKNFLLMRKYFEVLQVVQKANPRVSLFIVH